MVDSLLLQIGNGVVVAVTVGLDLHSFTQCQRCISFMKAKGMLVECKLYTGATRRRVAMGNKRYNIQLPRCY